MTRTKKTFVNPLNWNQINQIEGCETNTEHNGSLSGKAIVSEYSSVRYFQVRVVKVNFNNCTADGLTVVPHCGVGRQCVNPEARCDLGRLPLAADMRCVNYSLLVQLHQIAWEIIMMSACQILLIRPAAALVAAPTGSCYGRSNSFHFRLLST